MLRLLAVSIAQRGSVGFCTGDHGMVDLGREDYVDLDDMPTLVSGVRLPGAWTRWSPRRWAVAT